MTDSNFNNKQPIRGFKKVKGLFSDVEANFLDPINDNIYKQTESFLDWDIDVDLEKSLNNFYTRGDEGTYKDIKGDPYKQAAGLGIEVGSGVLTDQLTVGLLAGGPVGIGAYGVINFGSGFGSSILAQKTRGEDNINYGEAISAGLIQMIPFGSTAKIGKGGLKRAALQGASTAVADRQIQKLINEQELLSPTEFATSATLGAGLGLTFKGAIEGLESLSKKFAGKTAQEINNTITKEEKIQVDEIVKQASESKKILNQQPNNIEANETTKPKRVFQLPKSLQRMKPRYGLASIQFESELDQVAYIIRSGKTKSKAEDRIVAALEAQGFSKAEIKAHGVKVHQKVKDMVTEMTGSAKASPDNTSGLILKIPADAKYFGESVSTVAKKKKQDLGDKSKTPQQYTNKGVKGTFQEGIDQTIREMKDNNVFEGRKSQLKTKLGALNLYDDRVIDLKNSKRIRAMAEEYIKFYGERPPDELAFALAQNVVLASDGVVNANTKYVNALNSKDFKLIEQAADELNDALEKVEDWLTMDIKAVRTPFGRVGKTLQAKPDSGIAGKTPEEVMDMTPAQKREATEQVGESTLDFNEALREKRDFRALLKQRIQEAKESGDLDDLYRLANRIERTDGKVEQIVAMKKVDGFSSALDKIVRGVNEVGINALLSAPTTQEVNFISGVAQSYLAALKLALGSNNLKELEGAKKHLFALNSNLNFGLKAWKKSWDMEDNFVNIGNYKGDTGQRFMISSDGDNLASRFVDGTGKFIRLPMRLMTSTDALIQAPNIIAAATFESFNEGLRLGKQGDELDKFIKGHVDSILQYYAENGKVPLGSGSEDIVDTGLTEKILKQAQDFGKTITFTQDIRTEDYFGKGASALNKFANKHPLARFYFSFTKAPTNILKSNARLLPIINQPMVIDTGKGFTNLNRLNHVLLPEIRNDLLSADPIIAQQTRGEIRLGMGLAMLIGATAMDYRRKLRDEEFVPPIILTGGGPDFKKPEGAAMWKAMWKNGWRPYSKGTLQYDEDGEPLFGDDGEPVYVYETYENIPEPMAGYLRLMVDFINASGVIGDKPYDDFTIGWIGAVGRNIFNRSFTAQINELLNIFQAVPKVGEGDQSQVDSPTNYRLKKFSEYVGRTLTGRGLGAVQVGSKTIPIPIPYSNLGARLKQTPADVLKIMGFSNEEVQLLQQRVDTKVREGDAINQELSISDPDFNKHSMYQRALKDIINQSQEKFMGINYDLPFMYEHITNEPVLYPQKKGLDLFSLSRHSKSKNYKIYKAQKIIGRLLPEPKEIITGTITGGRKNVAPIKLNTGDYNKLKEVINTVKLDRDGFGEKTILESMNEFLESRDYISREKIIEENGLNSDFGRVAAQEIYLELAQINRDYIRYGENLYFESRGQNELQQRIDKKNKIKIDYINALEKQLNQLSN